MHKFERPLSTDCKIKITFMSVPMPIIGLFLCILSNLLAENVEQNLKLYKFLETDFLLSTTIFSSKR